MAELTERGTDISNVTGEVDLWNRYIKSIKEREGAEALEKAVQLAQETLTEGKKDFPLDIVSDQAIEKLKSRGVLVETPIEKYRFRHEQIRDYLYAWEAVRNEKGIILPENIIEEIEERMAGGVLRWVHLIYHKESPHFEAQFVRSMLDVR